MDSQPHFVVSRKSLLFLCSTVGRAVRKSSLFLCLSVASLSALFLYAGQAKASTVYGQLNAESNIDVLLDDLNNSYYQYFPAGAPVENPTIPAKFSITSSVNKFQIKILSGDTCTSFDSKSNVFIRKSSTTSFVFDSALDLGNGVCEFTYAGTSTVPAGEYEGVVVNPHNVPRDFILKGSPFNSGNSLNGFNNDSINGGYAFQLCLDTCSVDFGQNFQNFDASTEYETRFIDMNIVSPVEQSETTQFYESIVGSSNPGSLSATNYTMTNMADEVDGYYITEMQAECQLTSGSPFTVRMQIQQSGVTQQFANATCPAGQNWIVFDFSSNPYFVSASSTFGVRPIRQTSEGNGYLHGVSSSNWNLRISGYTIDIATGTAQIDVQYFINQSELLESVSSLNPTYVSFDISNRNGIDTIRQSELFDNSVATNTATTTFSGLADGTYDVLAKFSNFGCISGLSACPFPLSYIYSEFTLVNGVLSYNSSLNENYNNIVSPASELKYENCGISDISGCINNSFRFLFIPSTESVTDILSIKDTLSTKIPFSYAFDMALVVEELTNTSYNQDATIEVDILGGSLTLFSKTMVDNAPYVATFKTIITALLWLLLAFAIYRIVININTKENSL